MLLELVYVEAYIFQFTLLTKLNLSTLWSFFEKNVFMEGLLKLFANSC